MPDMHVPSTFCSLHSTDIDIESTGGKISILPPDLLICQQNFGFLGNGSGDR
jgi:hypothetical protein